MITVKDLMQCETQSSPDGKHWEPALPDGSATRWRARLQDALAVWRGEAIAIRQTTKADISKDYMERMRVAMAQKGGAA